MNRANDFWVSDRAHDLELGGWSLKLQREVLEELQASRARERELEEALSNPTAAWHEKTVQAVAERAAELLPPVEPQGVMMKSVWIGRLARAIDRALYVAAGEVGLIGDHPGIRLAAKIHLPQLRADVRAAIGPRTTHEGDPT